MYLIECLKLSNWETTEVSYRINSESWFRTVSSKSLEWIIIIFILCRLPKKIINIRNVYSLYRSRIHSIFHIMYLVFWNVWCYDNNYHQCWSYFISVIIKHDLKINHNYTKTRDFLFYVCSGERKSFTYHKHDRKFNTYWSGQATMHMAACVALCKLL